MASGKKYQLLLICILLAVVTLAVFWNVRQNDFINYDDPEYVSENPFIHHGLTQESLTWAFTSSHSSNWHPLTWISHMLDVQLYGANPAGHHLTNLYFHAANAVLLFLLLLRMTGVLWRSAFVAAAFAWHPLRVESVAWIAERKDVLSAFFWMLTLLAYGNYALAKKSPKSGTKWYFLSLIFFALGLMSKPMLVTLPFVLLLLDLWPLQRFSFRENIDVNRKQKNIKSSRFSGFPFRQLFIEKIPFFVLAAIACVITVWAQKTGGSVRTLTEVSVAQRLDNAVISYMRYIGKLFWPEGLAVFYPMPKSWPGWQVTVAVMILIFISTLAVKSLRRRPYFFVGWFLFLGTLVPVIGLMQVGIQALADRYTYLPMIGLYIFLAWGIYEPLAHWQPHRIVLGMAATIALLVCSFLTHAQVKLWRNSEVLFRHALQVTRDNYTAHENLGIILARQGKIEEAKEHFLAGLKLHPELAEAHHNLGNALLTLGQVEEAEPQYLEAIRIRPDYDAAFMNLGLIAVRRGDLRSAQNYYAKVVEIKPRDLIGHYNLATTFLQMGDPAQAIQHYQAALQIDPGHCPSLYQLGLLAMEQGRRDDATLYFTQVVELQPDHAEARAQLQQLNGNSP